MGSKLRPWMTYKAFGGILTVLGLPASILVILRDTPPGGGPPPPLSVAVVPGILGLIGLYVFLVSDRMIKRIEAEHGDTPTPKRSLFDWKAMLITFGALSLYFVLIALKAAGVL